MRNPPESTLAHRVPCGLDKRCPSSSRLVRATLAEARTLARHCWFRIRTQKRIIFATLVVGFSMGAWAFPHDRAILDFIQGPGDPIYKLGPAAMAISIWGDYLTFSVPLVVALALYGILRNRRRWRRAALACLFGASLAGLFTDCFRLTLGRPRPNAHLVDGLYGIQFTTQSRFESFPSGHAATAMGTAVALLIAEPALGAVALLFAVAVCWSRMELDRHYPSDVIIGASIGIYFGLMAGWAARTKRQDSPT